MFGISSNKKGTNTEPKTFEPKTLELYPSASLVGNFIFSGFLSENTVQFLANGYHGAIYPFIVRIATNSTFRLHEPFEDSYDLFEVLTFDFDANSLTLLHRGTVGVD